MLINVLIEGAVTAWPQFTLEADSEEAAFDLINAGQGEGNPLANGPLADEEVPFRITIRKV